MAPTVDLTSEAGGWRFSLLGGLRIVCAGQPTSSPPNRVHNLLALLLLNREPSSRERLVGALFPDLSERQARRRLSDLLWLLRRSLPTLPLVVTRQSVAIPSSSRWLDVEAFRQGAAADDLAEWQVALDLYQGELLPGCPDDFLLFEREALRMEYVRLLHKVCTLLFEREHFDQALPLVQRLVNEEPYDEQALRLLMRTHTALGQRGAALAAYDGFVGLAAGELGVEPEKATQALARSIQTLDSSPAASSVSPVAPLNELLAQAQLALHQGDWMVAKLCLERLESRALRDVSAIQLLAFDLALFREDYEQAEQVLSACKPGRASLLRQAALASALGRANIASERAAEALLLAHEEQDQNGELEALLCLAQAQIEQNQYALALSSAERALSLARLHNIVPAVVRARLLQGNVLMYQGHYRDALSIFHEVHSLAHEHGLRRYLAEALDGLGTVQRVSGTLLKALDFIEQALSLWRDLGIQQKEARTLHISSAIYAQLGRNVEALHAINQAREIYERLGNRLGAAKSQYHLAAGLPYYDEKLVGRAITLARQALQVFTDLDKTGWQASTWAILGYVLWLDEQHADALHALGQAYTLHENIGERAVLSELLAYQGLAYLGLRRPDEALECTRRALLALAQQTLESSLVSEIYYAHASALVAGGQEKKAHDYFVRAYDNLLQHAAQLADESARQSLFQRDPTTRRLMREVYARGIAPDPQTGIVTRWLSFGGAYRQHKLPVELTLDAGPSDAALKYARGAVALRRSRLTRVLQEAQAQGARATNKQLADALGVSPRTIKRDLAALRHANQI